MLDRNRHWPLVDIVTPHDNDVLCGRGGGTNSHPGNERYRRIVVANKYRYLSSHKAGKPAVAREVVAAIYNMDPPGRFIERDRKTKMYRDIGEFSAIQKVGQALREDAPSIRERLKADLSAASAGGPSELEVELNHRILDDYVASSKKADIMRSSPPALPVVSPSPPAAASRQPIHQAFDYGPIGHPQQQSFDEGNYEGRCLFTVSQDSQTREYTYNDVSWQTHGTTYSPNATDCNSQFFRTTPHETNPEMMESRLLDDFGQQHDFGQQRIPPPCIHTSQKDENYDEPVLPQTRLKILENYNNPVRPPTRPKMIDYSMTDFMESFTSLPLASECNDSCDKVDETVCRVINNSLYPPQTALDDNIPTHPDDEAKDEFVLMQRFEPPGLLQLQQLQTSTRSMSSFSMGDLSSCVSAICLVPQASNRSMGLISQASNRSMGTLSIGDISSFADISNFADVSSFAEIPNCAFNFSEPNFEDIVGTCGGDIAEKTSSHESSVEKPSGQRSKRRSTWPRFRKQQPKENIQMLSKPLLQSSS